MLTLSWEGKRAAENERAKKGLNQIGPYLVSEWSIEFHAKLVDRQCGVSVVV